MEKKERQMITAVFVIILILAAVFVLYHFLQDSNSEKESQKNITAALDYDSTASYKTFTLKDIISESDFIFKGTVIESTQNLGEKETLLKTDDILKGEINPEFVTIHSNYKPLSLEIDDEFIFFISKGYDGKYKVMTIQGYLKNNGTDYEGQTFKTTYSDLKNQIEKSNQGIVDPVDPVVVDTLEMTYWNPWGGRTATGGINIDYPAFTLADYITGSAIIVSATVTETVEWNDSTEEGRAKLKELGSPWRSSSNRECYLDVNDILKGNFEINHIYLKTDMKTPVLRPGEEYILFVDGSPTGGSDYEIRVTEGYLLKNGSNYEGAWPNIPVPEDDLMFLISLPSDDLSLYQNMAFSHHVFIGEMQTSTDRDKLVQTGGLESEQVHSIRVIDTIKGNLSGEINFTYMTSYITNDMMDNYLRQENWTLQNAINSANLESDGLGYFRPNYWDPQISPLKKGDIYIICLYEYEGNYYMGASTTDYKIEEHNKRKLQKMAQEYQITLEKIEDYIVYNYDY